ncbi:uncharacterized protein LOC131687827 [Topomyia yanbarensis]|uniref:uncharacterized protein LOC131687827 n=1 Tax=Topomyia yanbarensis TaxID=2498891 RepID=UPI00273B1846|nr:uncharacterized protein LOC131687827 [Topomyia yanbarensis]
MVQCDKCDDWFHFDCVEVSQAVENQDWLCSDCYGKQHAKNKKSTKPTPPTVPPVSTLATIVTTGTLVPKITSTSSINVTSTFVTSSMIYTPNTLVSPYMFNAPMPPHSLMPPCSYAQSYYMMPPNTPMQLNTSMPPMPLIQSYRLSNPSISSSGVNYYDRCYTVPSSFIQPIPSVPYPVVSSDVEPTTIPIGGQPKELPEQLHPRFPPKTKKQVLEDNMSQYSEVSSRRSTKQRQLKLQLQMLDDERKLQEAEEASKREYIHTRNQLMKEIVNEEDSIVDADEGLSDERVAEWLNDEAPAEVPVSQNQSQLPVYQSVVVPQLTNVWTSVGQMQIQDRVKNVNHQSTAVVSKFVPMLRSTPRQMPSGYENGSNLTHSQVAARQAVSRELPVFSGSPEEWPLFYSTFTTTTNMCGYTAEENLMRLQKCLRGKAYEAVNCRLMHPANVVGILSTLRMLYGNPEIIVQNLISKIQSTPAPKADKLETLIEFSLAVQNLCVTIEACELEEYSYNVALLHELVDKLPSGFKVEWAKYRRNLPRVHLSIFAKWLYELAEMVCPIANLHGSGARAPQGNKKNSAFLNAHSGETSGGTTDETNHQSNSNRFGANSRECLVCKGSCPNVEKCQRFTELGYNSKWATVKEFGLCRKCLRKHKGPCKSKQVCGTNGCTFKHHQLLHNNQREGALRSGSRDSHSATVAQDISVRECNAHHKATNKGLFRVAPIVIHGPVKSIKTFAFLDDGSSLTLVDASLVQELKLQGTPEPLCLKWTGNKRRMESDSMDEVGPRSFRNGRDTELMCKEYPHLRGIPIESYINVQPRILIGIDNANLTFPLKGREGKMYEPIATKTRLGWIIHGGSNTGEAVVGHHNHSVQTCPCSERSDGMLQQAVREYFSLDGLGIYRPEKQLYSVADQRAQQLMQSASKTESGRYEVSLLWKFDEFRLPISKPVALRRFHCLEARMKKQPELAQVLRAKIEDYRKKGYIRKLSDEELQVPQERVWYLPLFPVFNPNKPGKVRIVWDAAAKTNGVSLNSMLLTGPDLLTPLYYVLFRFREFRVGLSGDVKEMYLQMAMSKKDQHCLRVLWCDDASGEPSTYVTQVMPFGTCCSPSCAQFIKNLNASKIEGQYPVAAQAIIKQHYVDDMLVSVESEQEAIQLAMDVKFLHAQAGFDMRNWISNSPAVMKALKENNKDEISLNIGAELTTEKEVWRSGIGWDEVIPECLNEKWEKWLEILPMVQTISIPRCYRSATQLSPQTNIQLHTFVDASLSGYAAVVYLRFEQGSTVEPQSLESQSLSFNVHQRFFWSDSRDVLCWIRSDHRRYSQFVAFRVSEVLETTGITDWRYKCSKENVADEATKWQGFPDLTEDSKWFKGPKCLWERSDSWPSNPYEDEHTEEELRANLFHHRVEPEPIITVQDYSQWERLLRATVTTLRAAQRLRSTTEEAEGSKGSLTDEELKQAANYLYRLAQTEGFPDEMGVLRAKVDNKVLPKSSSIYTLNPFLDEQHILRMQGRISACEYASMDAKNPIDRHRPGSMSDRRQGSQF